MKKRYCWITSFLVAVAIAAAFLPNHGNIFNLARANNTKSGSFTYVCSSEASVGEIHEQGQNVYDSQGRYVNRFVSNGEYSNSGLTLTNGNFIQFDLKGSTGVTIEFTSGRFAIELSNNNSNFSNKRFLNSTETYHYYAEMRYVRVLCVEAGLLTQVTLDYSCLENYYLNTTVNMDDNAWTTDSKNNPYTLVGKQKGNDLQDFNYYKMYTTKDSYGLYVYVYERVAYSYMSGNTWYSCDNFEIRVNNSINFFDAQVYASVYDYDHGNFDVVMSEKQDKIHEYDTYNNIKYKCFISYTTISSRLNKTVTSSDDLYIWFGSADGFNFNHCSTWRTNANKKVTTSGIVSLSNTRLVNDYSNLGNSWDDKSRWINVSEEIPTYIENEKQRVYTAVELHGCKNADLTNWGDFCWRTTLGVLREPNSKSFGTTFRMDWWGWNWGYQTEPEIDKGVSWASNDQWLKTVLNCDVVYLSRLNGLVYELVTVVIPYNSDEVGRGDFYYTQKVTFTSSQTLGLSVASEWSEVYQFIQ